MSKFFLRIKSRKKSKSDAGLSAFGVPLDVLAAREGYPIPNVLLQCVTCLESGLPTDMLFSDAPWPSKVAEIRAIFEDGNGDLEGVTDYKEVVAVLKQFLRELPTPILGTKKYAAIAATPSVSQEGLHEHVLGVLKSLPESHVPSLAYLVQFLSRVAWEKGNGTNEKALGRIIGPVLQPPQPGASMAADLSGIALFTTYLIANFSEIFGDAGDDPTEEEMKSIESSQSRSALPPDLPAGNPTDMKVKAPQGKPAARPTSPQAARSRLQQNPPKAAEVALNLVVRDEEAMARRRAQAMLTISRRQRQTASPGTLDSLMAAFASKQPDAAGASHEPEHHKVCLSVSMPRSGESKARLSPELSPMRAAAAAPESAAGAPASAGTGSNASPKRPRSWSVEDDEAAAERERATTGRRNSVSRRSRYGLSSPEDLATALELPEKVGSKPADIHPQHPETLCLDMPSSAPETAAPAAGSAAADLAAALGVSLQPAAVGSEPTRGEFSDAMEKGSTMGNSAEKTAPVASVPPPAIEQPPPTPPSPKAKVKKMRAIYSFAARNGAELSLEPGDEITVTETHESGWWNGTSLKGEGYFPSNYCEPTEYQQPRVFVIKETKVSSNIKRLQASCGFNARKMMTPEAVSQSSPVLSAATLPDNNKSGSGSPKLALLNKPHGPRGRRPSVKFAHCVHERPHPSDLSKEQQAVPAVESVESETLEQPESREEQAQEEIPTFDNGFDELFSMARYLQSFSGEDDMVPKSELLRVFQKLQHRAEEWKQLQLQKEALDAEVRDLKAGIQAPAPEVVVVEKKPEDTAAISAEQLQELQEELRRAEQVSTMHQVEAEQLRDKLREAQDQQTALRETEKELRAERATLLASEARLKEAVGELEGKITLAGQSADSLQQTCAKQTAELNAARAECQSLVKRDQELSSCIQNLEQEAEQAKTTAASLREQLAERDRQIEQLQHEIADLNKKLEEKTPSAPATPDAREERKRSTTPRVSSSQSLKGEQTTPKAVTSPKVVVAPAAPVIRVYFRVRPVPASNMTIRYPAPNTADVEAPGHASARFVVDAVWDEASTQQDVFKAVKPYTQAAIDGKVLSVFAFGQYGGGKTHTLIGTPQSPGIIAQTIAQIFETVPTNITRTVECCMLEWYASKLTDLLLPSSEETRQLTIKRDKGIIHIGNAAVRTAANAAELGHIFSEAANYAAANPDSGGSGAIGERGREEGMLAFLTALAARNALSHLLFFMWITSTNKETAQATRGKITFVDLASTPPQDSGTRSKAQQAVSASLSALRGVIAAVVAGDPAPPFQTTKLTQIMSDSIGGNAITMSKPELLRLRNAAETKAAVTALRDETQPTNWLLFAYTGANVSPREVELVATGAGGLDELRGRLPRDAVRFALFEVVASQRARTGRIAAPGATASEAAYAPSKYVFMTWVGAETPAGIDKARAAGDAPQLAAELRDGAGVAIAGFVQYAAAADVSYDDAARKIAQVAGPYVSGARGRAAGPEHEARERAPGRVSIEFDESCRAGLADVRDGRARWALIGFTDAASSRGALRLVATGTGGAREVAERWRRDTIQYAVVSVAVAAQGMSSGAARTQQEFRKTVVVTMMGEDVAPLARSRSAGQRGDLLDFVLSVMPLHVHFQPENADEVTDTNIFAKCQNHGK
eukprot:m51a1_g482 hypothetical protein (1662) ;mRNA; f:211369-217821